MLLYEGPEAARRPIAYHSGPLPVTNVELAPGTSTLIKTKIPKVFLQPNTCKLQAVLEDSGQCIAVSEVAEIQVVGRESNQKSGAEPN
jgi:hypothetical protein